MSITPLHHYSIENNPTIYDEEALTALELVARLTGKFNEFIADHNRLEETIRKMYGDEMARMVGEWLEKHPEITTTLQEGEITLDKLHESLKTQTVKDYVTPYMFGAVGDGVADDTEAIRQAMASGDRVYFSGKFLITGPLQLRSYMELWGDKGTEIFTNDDTSILVGGEEEVHGVYIHDLWFKNDHNCPTHYHLDLQNLNMGRIFRCRIDTASKDYNAVGGIKVWTTLDGMFSPLVMACDLRNSSIWMDITDGYIIGSNIWSQNRQFAVRLTKNSWQIASCQFVGGKMGAVWVDGAYNDTRIQQVRITNCYFDGSWEYIQSGVGLRAYDMCASAITGNTFWAQKEEGMILENCQYCAITGNVFDENGRNNLTESALYNRAEPFYDIVIKGDATFLNISNNTFRMTERYHIPGGCLDTREATGIKCGNTLIGNNATSYGFYCDDPFHISAGFDYNGNILANVCDKNPANVLNNGLTVNGRLECLNGHRGYFYWGINNTNDGWDTPGDTGLGFPTYVMPDMMALKKMTCYINTPVTEGKIDVYFTINGVKQEKSKMTFEPGMQNPYVITETWGRGEIVTAVTNNIGVIAVAEGTPARNIQVTAIMED